MTVVIVVIVVALFVFAPRRRTAPPPKMLRDVTNVELAGELLRRLKAGEK